MTTSLSNMEEEIVLEAIVCYQNFKTGSGGDTYVDGLKQRLLIHLVSDMGLKMRAWSKYSYCVGKSGKGPIHVKSVDLRNSLWRQFYR